MKNNLLITLMLFCSSYSLAAGGALNSSTAVEVFSDAESDEDGSSGWSGPSEWMGGFAMDTSDPGFEILHKPGAGGSERVIGYESQMLACVLPSGIVEYEKCIFRHEKLEYLLVYNKEENSMRVEYEVEGEFKRFVLERLSLSGKNSVQFNYTLIGSEVVNSVKVKFNRE